MSDAGSLKSVYARNGDLCLCGHEAWRHYSEPAGGICYDCHHGDRDGQPVELRPGCRQFRPTTKVP